MEISTFFIEISSSCVDPRLISLVIAEHSIRTLSGEKLKALRKQTHLDQRGFAKLSNNSRETVIKFEKRGKVSSGAKRGITEATRLILALSKIMEPENIANWLTKPNRNYQNKSPMDLIEEGRSDIIWGIIERARQGSFS